MVKIRQKVFETNSSSTHSIVLVSEGFEALKNLYPDIYNCIKTIEGVYFTKDEVKAQFEAIGGSINSKGELDISNIDPKEYDFGYVDETWYADAAHKILLVLSYIINDDYWDYNNYFKECANEALKDYGINSVKSKANQLERVDHQCCDELLDSFRYKVKDFMFRKDYVLHLDHD